MVDNVGGVIVWFFKIRVIEFLEKELVFCIVLEFWFKWFVVGGIDKVFEIGFVFWNEGIDGIYNFEFMICEFYSVYFNLVEFI